MWPVTSWHALWIYIHTNILSLFWSVNTFIYDYDSYSHIWVTTTNIIIPTIVYCTLIWYCIFWQVYTDLSKNSNISYTAQKLQPTKKKDPEIKATVKEPSMGLFKCWCKCCTSLSHTSCLIVCIMNKHQDRHYWCLIAYIAPRNAMKL